MRHFLQKMSTYQTTTNFNAGYYMSEKLDGIRVLWDGGVSRGDMKSNVPWANTKKDHRFVNEPVATGLWTQYGHPIQAPNWWLDKMPNAVIEGELYAGRGNWQQLSSAVKKHMPVDSEWKAVELVGFDTPDIGELFGNGKVRYEPGYDHLFRGCLDYFFARGEDVKRVDQRYSYNIRRALLRTWYDNCVEEKMIRGWKAVEPFYSAVLDVGGEGLVFKSQDNLWDGSRSKTAYKLKPWHDDEAKVTGYTKGKGRHVGRVGALVVNWKGVRLELSGMTDAEREYDAVPVGSVVTFRYRELSDSGVPKEARYMRIRGDV